MANRDNPKGFWWVKSLMSGEASPITVDVPITASTTIAVGDAVILSSGYGTVALYTSGAIYGVAVEAIATTASGAGSTGTIKVIPALPWYVFRGQCEGTYAITVNGTSVDIEGATGVMEINENATTEKVVRVIGLSDLPNNAIGANSVVDFVWARSQYLGILEAA